MKSILHFSFLFIFLTSFAQTKFEKGYFINNSDQKMDCLIKNVDWKNNPTQFEYKIGDTGDVKTGTIADVKEFNVIGAAKYIRATVDIDMSQENINMISTQREPLFKKQQVFLKVLVEGTNNLYAYEATEYPTRLFYSNQTNPVQQLIYKKFYNLHENKTDIYFNEDFKRQLYSNVNCEKNAQSAIEGLRYRKSDVIPYFIKINNCLGDTPTKQPSIDTKTKINFKPVVSVNSTSLMLDFKSGIFAGKYDMGSKTNFGFGLEVEFVLPYNNNSWSIAAEPSYITSFESEVSIYKPGFIYPDYTMTATYNYIQVPVSGRKYFYLNKSSKLFLNAGVNINIIANSSEVIITRDPDVEMENINLGGTALNFTMGLGYQYKKINLELRYYTTNEIAPEDHSNDSFSYKNASLNLKYSLF